MTADSTHSTVYPVDPDFAAKAHIDAKKYEEMYAASIKDPEAFWGEHGKRVDWIKPFTEVKNVFVAVDSEFSS